MGDGEIMVKKKEQLAKKPEEQELKPRYGERINPTIKTAEIGRAPMQKIESSGGVNITSNFVAPKPKQEAPIMSASEIALRKQKRKEELTQKVAEGK